MAEGLRCGLREPVKRGIAGLMVSDPAQPGFHRLAQAVNPQAVVSQVEPSAVPDDRAVLAWEIAIDPAAEPAEPSEWADVTGRSMWDHDNTQHYYHYERYDAAGT